MSEQNPRFNPDGYRLDPSSMVDRKFMVDEMMSEMARYVHDMEGDPFKGSKSSGGTNESPVINILDYTKHKSYPYSSYNHERFAEGTGETDHARNFSHFFRSTYNDQMMGNIEEEQILIRKFIEYSLPDSLDCQGMFQTAYGGDVNHFINSDVHRNSPNCLQRSFFNNLSEEYSSWPKELSEFRPFYNTNETSSNKLQTNCLYSETNSRMTPIRKYSPTFLSNECVLEQLNQQNILAQQLIDKYFEKTENELTDLNVQKTRELPMNMDKKHSTQENFGNSQSDTVSTLLQTYVYDKGEQVCIKPSDQYVFKNDKFAEKNLLRQEHSVKFVKPYRYHKKFWDSGSKVDCVSRKASSLDFDEPVTKRSRRDFDSNIALNQDSSKEVTSLSDSNIPNSEVRYLDAKHADTGPSSSNMNKLLYKKDSKTLEHNNSSEDIYDKSAFLPERYMSLRNLYSRNYLENIYEQYPISPYNFHSLRPKRSETFSCKALKYLDSGSHIQVTDEDYKRWLKENDFIRYTDFTNSTPSTITTFRSVSQRIVNYAVVSYPNLKSERKRKHGYLGFNEKSQEVIHGSRNLLSISYENMCEFVLCEHAAAANFINILLHLFGTDKLRKLSVVDRIFQMVFIITCYYIVSLMNRIFAAYSEKLF